jgi:hypothetical protein
MNTYIDSRQINLSSDTAKQVYNGSYNSNCFFELFGFLLDEDDIIQTQLSVQSAQIPISYYVINQYNKTLRFQLGTGPITTINFTEGNYNSSSFIDEMKKQIPSLVLVFDKITGKYSFARTASFIFYAFGSTCFKVLGLNPDQNYSVLTSPYNLVAPFPCQFQGITRIKIASNEFSTYSMDSRNGGFSNALTSLAVNSASYGILIYENSSQFKPTLRNKIINSFDIQLLDDDDNLINFNKIDWRITLQLDITRKQQHFNRVFPKFSNIIEEPENQEVQPDPNIKENIPEPTENIPETTGDDDLDFLLYQKGIYQ